MLRFLIEYAIALGLIYVLFKYLDRRMK